LSYTSSAARAYTDANDAAIAAAEISALLMNFMIADPS
jgi:hypothetical protein